MKSKTVKPEKAITIKFKVKYRALRPPITLNSYKEALSFARNNAITKETGLERERVLAAMIEPVEMKTKNVETHEYVR